MWNSKVGEDDDIRHNEYLEEFVPDSEVECVKTVDHLATQCGKMLNHDYTIEDTMNSCYCNHLGLCKKYGLIALPPMLGSGEAYIQSTVLKKTLEIIPFDDGYGYHEDKANMISRTNMSAVQVQQECRNATQRQNR
ncbi:unnamed protein product [Thelazia callipaeda]|uniref:MR_MLE_C domain-containing protein n=1 Tax=Thelazia callipaeda TaxID=103827 RepID=A0A0N5CQ66_THECL|nr:unnamed protein product [Thelazia callipaeda]